MTNVFGVDNIAIWSQLDPSKPRGTPDLNRCSAALDYADAVIIDFFREHGNYTSPLTPNSPSARMIVTTWAAKIAGIWLYENRGTRDEAENHKFEKMRAAVFEDMALHVTARKLDAVKRWPTSTAPIGV
jgi:hypothetical protein